MPANATISHEDWKDRWTQSLALFEALHGWKSPLAARASTPEQVVEVLNEICSKAEASPGAKTPSNTPLPPVTAGAPAIQESGEYILFRLNATTETAEFVSTRTGGIVYEDVFWALLAAGSIAANSKHCLPVAETNADLWDRSMRASREIRDGTFRESAYLEPIKGFFGEKPKPHFSLLRLKGEQLIKLRNRGMLSTSVDGALTFFELFGTKKPK